MVSLGLKSIGNTNVTGFGSRLMVKPQIPINFGVTILFAYKMER